MYLLVNALVTTTQNLSSLHLVNDLWAAVPNQSAAWAMGEHYSTLLNAYSHLFPAVF